MKIDTKEIREKFGRNGETEIIDGNHHGTVFEIMGVIDSLCDAYDSLQAENEELKQKFKFENYNREAAQQQLDELKKQMEWQTIDTAPKDGTKIILAKFGATEAIEEFDIPSTPYQIYWASLGFWSEEWGNWNDGIEPNGLASPTHWMPLPTAKGEG